MAVSRFTNSSIQSGLPKYDNAWDGNTAVGAMEPISSIILNSAQAVVEFNNIPQTYTHLQLRMFTQQVRATYGIANVSLTFNGDTAANYSVHGVYGNGASAATANNYSTQSNIGFGEGTSGTNTGGTFGIAIMDIFEYANTNIYKTTRTLTGVDINGVISTLGGRVGLWAGNWRNTNGINKIIITGDQGNFTQYSSFSLYGIK